MNQNLTNIIEYFKNGDIDKVVAENELSRILTTERTYVSVVLDELENKSNTSYVAMIVPELVETGFRETFVLDKGVVESQLSSDNIALLLTKMNDLVPQMNSLYHSFMSEHKDTETSYLECITLFIKMYCELIIALPDTIFDTVSDFKSFVQQDTSDILLSIQSGNDTIEDVVHHILIKHTLPKLALDKAEELFKKINIPTTTPDEKILSQDEPEANVMYADMASHSTGLINPEWRQDIDPFYVSDK